MYIADAAGFTDERCMARVCDMATVDEQRRDTFWYDQKMNLDKS